jgi:hypothetical protein
MDGHFRHFLLSTHLLHSPLSLTIVEGGALSRMNIRMRDRERCLYFNHQVDASYHQSGIAAIHGKTFKWLQEDGSREIDSTHLLGLLYTLSGQFEWDNLSRHGFAHGRCCSCGCDVFKVTVIRSVVQYQLSSTSICNHLDLVIVPRASWRK